MVANTHSGDDAGYSKKQKLLYLTLGLLLLVAVTLLLVTIGPKSLTDRPEASIDAPAPVSQLLS